MIHWDPKPELTPFNIPFLNRPILWYGFLFALGFFCAYLIVLYVLKRDKNVEIRGQAKFLVEKLTLYVIMGVIIGAKLGDLIFYQDWSYFKTDPLSFFKVWERGLSSHGGAVGVFVAIFLFIKKYRKKIPLLSWRRVLDWMCLPAGLVGAFIRLGNFINQEILGTPADVPWAVSFGHPIDGSSSLPRHPVQIYEALFYLCLFGICFFIYQTKTWREGKLAGFFLLTMFIFRFLIEFFKEKQSYLMSAHSYLDMGQLLSVPFIILGVYLLFLSSSK